MSNKVNKKVDYGWQHDLVVWLATTLNVPVLTEKDLQFQRSQGFQQGLAIGISNCSKRYKRKMEKAQQLRAVGKTEQAIRCEETAHQLKCVQVELEFFSKVRP